jgi:hypothetical protein
MKAEQAKAINDLLKAAGSVIPHPADCCCVLCEARAAWIAAGRPRVEGDAPLLAVLRAWVERRTHRCDGPDDGVKSYLAGFVAGGTSDAKDTLAEIGRLAGKARVVIADPRPRSDGIYALSLTCGQADDIDTGKAKVYIVTEEGT